VFRQVSFNALYRLGPTRSEGFLSGRQETEKAFSVSFSVGFRNENRRENDDRMHWPLIPWLIE
jgi:hypothetical protein